MKRENIELPLFGNQGAENSQTNLFCLRSTHTKQNQYSPYKAPHNLSVLCNYISQMQLLDNYLCPLSPHELQDDKTDIVWIFFFAV